MLNFGGKVIKNVAGYDVSRLMAGALGTLGVILQASLKVLPRPATEITLQFELDQGNAITRMNQLAGQPLPISAAAWVGGVMMLRLEGSVAGHPRRASETGRRSEPARRCVLAGRARTDGRAVWRRYAAVAAVGARHHPAHCPARQAGRHLGRGAALAQVRRAGRAHP